LGIAIAGFIGLGGASGVGQRIGRGLSSGFTDFATAFTSGLSFANAEQGGQQTETTAPSELTGQQPGLGLPNLFDSLEKQGQGAQGLTNFFTNLFSGALFNPGAFRTSLAFNDPAIASRIGFQSINKGIARTNFGGFGSGNAQELALQQAILESQRDNPSFFLRG